MFAAVSGWIGAAGAQNIVVNGDFETPPDNALTGWTVTGDVAKTGDEGFTTPSNAAAFSVGANSQGDMLSQILGTTAGQSYTLDFDAGVFGVRSLGPLSLQVQVFGAGMDTLLDETVVPPYNGNFDFPSFGHYTFSFTADSASSTLKFTDMGLGNNSADIVLDTVSVVASVPEPVSSMLLLVGGGVLALVRGRRSARI